MPFKRKKHLDLKEIALGYIYGTVLYFIFSIAILYLAGYGDAIMVLTGGDTGTIFLVTLISGFISFVVTEEVYFKPSRKKRR